MSLLSRRENVSAFSMLRLLTALLVCVLVFSHGTMGIAAPHGDVAGHSHVGEHPHDAQLEADDGDHHSDLVDIDADTADSRSQSNDSKSAEVAHAHATADQVPETAALPGQPLGGMRPTGLVVSPLASAPQAPLLEPPSA